MHWQCGSDHIPGCRAAATTTLLQLAMETRADFIVAVELEESAAEPINLLSHGLSSGWTQVNGSCPGNNTGGDAMGMALGPNFTVLKSDGGCLGGHAGGWYKADSRAFAVALVRPPVPVEACPSICVIGLHSPHVDITLGADKVERVCGEARHGCVVAAGDWNAPVSKKSFCNYTVADRWRQLLGSAEGEVQGSEGLLAAPDERSARLCGLKPRASSRAPNVRLTLTATPSAPRWQPAATHSQSTQAGTTTL